MERKLLEFWALVCLSLTLSAALALADTLHTPAKGSAERKAIMDALRGKYSGQYGEAVLFQVHYLKVHSGWAWVDVTPLDAKGKAIAEGGTSLLNRKDGSWSVIDLSTIPADPKNPLGDQEASPGFIKNLLNVYPQAPLDIFPKGKK